MILSKETPATRLHLNGARFYFDRDERVTSFSLQCKSCRAYPFEPDREPHVYPCSPKQSEADSLERIHISIAKLRMKG